MPSNSKIEVYNEEVISQPTPLKLSPFHTILSNMGAERSLSEMYLCSFKDQALYRDDKI